MNTLVSQTHAICFPSSENTMQFMGAGFSVSHSLCSKLVGASLSIGYSFNDAPVLREVEATFFDGNADGFGFEALVFGENILDLGAEDE